MRIGYALDTHAPPSRAQEVAWPRLREQVVLAEAVGFDLVLVPDHLLYRAGGDNDYAREHEPVGAWESVVLATAIAGATARLTVGHSMMNAPYRSAFLTAKVAATLDEVTRGPLPARDRLGEQRRLRRAGPRRLRPSGALRRARRGRQRAAARSILALAELGVGEVRCYLSSDGTHASRMAAIESMAGVVEEAHAT